VFKFVKVVIMHLLNFTIDKIIIHQIYRKDDEGNRVPPTQSNSYTKFDSAAMNEFKTRVRDALGVKSSAVKMEVFNNDDSGLPVLVDNMIDQDEDTFAVSSYDIAQKLTEAQNSKSMPGGIVVIFSGRDGIEKKKFLGIIKAEIHSAYQKMVNPKTKEISLKFVKEVLLTPGTRLYKTAAFFENPEYDKSSADLKDKWTVMVSDHQMSSTSWKAAAHYFYSDFLGCGYPESSARTTKLFYDSAKSFITDLEISQVEKNDLYNALNIHLKVKKSGTISLSGFAEEYFEEKYHDDFTGYMEGAGLPATDFVKDTAYVEKELKQRRVKFTSNVRVVGPTDAFNDLVKIEEIKSDPDQPETSETWTKIIIKDRISKQE
jgi:hypothetical protein